MFLLIKEFKWTPKQIKEQDAKDIKAVTHILSTYNKVKNAEMESAARTRASAPRSTGSSRGGMKNKFIRKEKIGPDGTIQVQDVPI